jgi:hypothetical protein
MEKEYNVYENGFLIAFCDKSGLEAYKKSKTFKKLEIVEV